MSLMNGAFKLCLDSFMIVFIGDILFFLKNEEEHVIHLCTVLSGLGMKELFA